MLFGRPRSVFRVLPIGLVLSSNNSFWFFNCFEISRLASLARNDSVKLRFAQNDSVKLRFAQNDSVKLRSLEMTIVKISVAIRCLSSEPLVCIVL